MGADTRWPEWMGAWEKLQNINEEISQLEQKIQALEAGEKIEASFIDVLTTKLPDPKDVPDDEKLDFKQTYALLQNAKIRLENLRLKKVELSVKVPGQKENDIQVTKEKSFDEIKKSLKWNLAKEIAEKPRDDLSVEDIYRMKQAGVDLATVFLKNRLNNSSYSKKEVKIGDAIIVDFAKNEDAHRLIGAGDLLPIEVTKVKINWVEWEYKNNPRPGFYNGNKYLPIYDGYTIDIVSTQKLDSETNKDQLASYDSAHFDRFSKYREWSIKTYLYSNLDKSELNFDNKGDLEVFKKLSWGRFEKNFEMKQELDWSYNLILKSGKLSDVFSMTNYLRNTDNAKEFLNWKSTHEKYKSSLTKYAEKYSVPVEILTHLIYKENSRWYINAKNGSSSAYGLGQFIKSTWNDSRIRIRRNGGGDIWSHGIPNAEVQIQATAELLAHNRAQKDCTWQEAVAYHNTGLWILSSSRSNILHVASINGVISNKIPWVRVVGTNIVGGKNIISPDKYFTAAVAYYNDISYSKAESYRYKV